MMKFSLFASGVLAIVLAALPVFAQPDSSKRSKTSKSPEPIAIPTPAGAPSTALPTEQVREFFRILTEGRVDAAYDELLRGTPIAGMAQDVANLKLKTREAIRVFGNIGGYENVDEKNIGTGLHLKRITCLSLNKQFPIRWRLYFYNADPNLDVATGARGIWKLIDIRIDDRLVDMFEESTPGAAAAPAK